MASPLTARPVTADAGVNAAARWADEQACTPAGMVMVDKADTLSAPVPANHARPGVNTQCSGMNRPWLDIGTIHGNAPTSSHVGMATDRRGHLPKEACRFLERAEPAGDGALWSASACR